MYGLDEMELDQARQHHAQRVREAALERSLAVSSTNAEYASGIGAVTAIGIMTNGMRSWLRWLTAPRQRPAGAAR